MDAVFGPRNFRNEIICCDEGPNRASRRQFATAHEAVLWYSNGPRWTFNGHVEAGSQGSFLAATELGVRITVSSHSGDGDGPRSAGSKSLALLERVIRVGSNPGDLVLDPFCVDGNSRTVASRLGRGWIGVGTASRIGVGSRDA